MSPATTGAHVVFAWDEGLGPTPTAHLTVSDATGRTVSDSSLSLHARPVTSTTAPHFCTWHGHWAAVRARPDGPLVDATATATAPGPSAG